MAIDGNFLAFLVPALIAVLAAAVAFPSKSRIERNPSTAYGGGKRAFVALASILALIIGAALAGLGGTQNLESVVAGINMVQIGGISLVIMGVVLLIASAMISRQIRRAGRGAQEQVLEVAAFPVAPRPIPPGRTPPPRGATHPPRNLPPRNLPPRDLPPRDYPPREHPPSEYRPQQGVPPPRDIPPRRIPPPRDGAPAPPPRVERRPPPRRYPPPE